MGSSHLLYALQTKILERGTKDEMRRFEVLLNSVITRFGLRAIYAAQTKILEDRTKDRSCLRLREALFNE